MEHTYHVHAQAMIGVPTRHSKDLQTESLEIIGLNPLNPTGRYTCSHEGVPNTLRASIPAFAMVCQKPEEAL